MWGGGDKMSEEQIKVKVLKAINLSQKEVDLIMFIRHELPFGQFLLTTHNGQPESADDVRKRTYFGKSENGQRSADNNK